MNRKSFVYQELTENEIHAVIDSAFHGEKILEYGLLSGGLFNTTYRVRTEKHDVVLRMGPVNRELLLPYEHNLMRAECETFRLCRENGIPASNVLCVDTSRKVIDRDFMVVERIESKPLCDPSIPEETHPYLHCECGRLIKKMHEIEGRKFGRVSDILLGKGYDTWSEAVEAEFVKIFDTARKYNLFTKELEEKTFEYIRDRREILNKITVPHLTHCDIWGGNILVNKKEEKYEVCAIIDGDRAFFGDSDIDLSRIWRYNEDFLRGYGDVNTDFTEEEVQEKRNVYCLMLDLNDAYIWIIEYDNLEAYRDKVNASDRLLGIEGNSSVV